MPILGVDTGGTFTDFVYFDGHEFRVHKVLSTPQAPERAIVQGLAEMGLSTEGLRVVHGSTVATNAVLEGKGVRTAYISNHGLGDVLSIGRQARRDLYDLQPPTPPVPVASALCLETGGRIGADGVVLEPLTDADLALLRTALERLAPQAVAINLLFSFVDARFEQAIEAVVPQDMFVSRSSWVLPEYSEYERGMATWLNAYVGPLMQGYLQRLCEALAPAQVTVMQSHGGVIGAEQAGRRSVALLLSGPAGGLVGARHVAAQSGCTRLLSLDMGGTSTDVALIQGDIRLTSEGEIGGYPVAVPMVDMHTIGAGGGSIARVDEAGVLQVGPQSAGAQPGPACYAQGGLLPTVTDANLVLGRLPEQTALGGGVRLDLQAARRALQALAEGLGTTLQEAALGVVRLANEHMAQALRVISVQRGIDPAGLVLMPFGGAGGLHVCALADALGMDDILLPRYGGVLSALGMLVAPPARQYSHTVARLLQEMTAQDLEAGFASLAARGRAELAQEGVTTAHVQASLDLRYEGQSSTLSVAWQADVAQAQAGFHAAHRQAYGHALDMPVECVTLRLGVSGDSPPLALAPLKESLESSAKGMTLVYGVPGTVPVYQRQGLTPGQVLEGPSLICEQVATTWLEAGWRAQVEGNGNLRVRRISL